MGVEGIGARIARKEDKRFITGGGRYTDDMVVPGMKHAAFVRSPHAHAKIVAIDVAKAKAMPGVIGVLTGQELKADGIGNLICGWMIHSKDGSPMKMGAWSPLAVDRVRYVGDAVVVVVAETQGPGARRGRGGRGDLSRAAGGDRQRRVARRRAPRSSIRRRTATSSSTGSSATPRRRMPRWQRRRT